jgi:hypothetical protein
LEHSDMGRQSCYRDVDVRSVDQLLARRPGRDDPESPRRSAAIRPWSSDGTTTPARTMAALTVATVATVHRGNVIEGACRTDASASMSRKTPMSRSGHSRARHTPHRGRARRPSPRPLPALTDEELGEDGSRDAVDQQQPGVGTQVVIPGWYPGWRSSRRSRRIRRRQRTRAAARSEVARCGHRWWSTSRP